MHISSLENMDRALGYYSKEVKGTIIDIGAMNVNGSYRELFGGDVNYIGLDLEPGPGVDIVLDDPYILPFESNSVDLVISGQMLEHCAFFWKTFEEISRILSKNGVCIMIAPSSGPAHYKVDYYRFYSDAWSAIAEWSKLNIVDQWIDKRGEWHDNVAIFQKGMDIKKVLYPRARRSMFNMSRREKYLVNSDESRFDISFPELQKKVIEMISRYQPNEYLQIGAGLEAAVISGHGTFVSDRNNIFPSVDVATYYRCSSDDFFHFFDNSNGKKFDLAYIRGKYLFDDIYRDFINIEQMMNPSGAIIVDGIIGAEHIGVTSGDVHDSWKFLEIIKQHRKNLQINTEMLSEHGLVIISKLEPNNKILLHRYNSFVMNLLK